MSIAIVDDTLSCANMVQKEVQQYFPLDTMQVFLTNFEELLTYPFDICFIDIMLEETDGIQLAIQYSKIYPTCKIVFISNYDNLVYNSLVADLFFFIRKGNLVEDMKCFYKKYIVALEDESKIMEVISNK